jgi:thioredoxin 1
MNKTARILIFAAVVAVAALAFVAKENKKSRAAAPIETNATNAASLAITTTAKLPRLIDLGAGKCIPCKKMAPILEELRTDFVGRLEVVFIDVWEKPDAATPYNINLIPTQIFFDAEGRELFRHEGFFSREDILNKWKELGVDLSAASPADP